MRILASDQSSNQIDPGHDVAILIGSTDLDRAFHRAIQMQKIVGLQDHVTELGVGDPLLALGETSRDRLLLNHHVDREVLAHVSKHLDVADATQPVVVVDDPCTSSMSRIEIKQAFEGRLVVGDVRLDLVTAEELSLLALSGGITDQSGRPPHQRKWPMTGPLPVGEHLDAEDSSRS